MTDLFHAIEKLENSNLNILSELFECQVEDLHISRSVTKQKVNHGNFTTGNLTLNIKYYVRHKNKSSNWYYLCGFFIHKSRCQQRFLQPRPGINQVLPLSIHIVHSYVLKSSILKRFYLHPTALITFIKVFQSNKTCTNKLELPFSSFRMVLCTICTTFELTCCTVV